MNEAEIGAVVESERLSLCKLLEDLDPADWTVVSLCPDWTVRDVVAHLTTTTRATKPDMILAMIRARGNFHRMTSRTARRRASAFTPAELVAQLRDTAGSTRRMPGSGPMDPLVDVLVHGQDIAHPLGRDRALPREAAAAALAYTANNAFYGAPNRFAQLRLVATDADWTSGEAADEVRGPIRDLLLVATGRPTGLAGLAGTGLERLNARFAGASG
ncbi:MAG: maleylpyruvate isomerase family mycothiol-dependent enzyme [Marmoricola sp.]